MSTQDFAKPSGPADAPTRHDSFALLSEAVRTASTKAELFELTASIVADHFGAPIACVNATVGGDQIDRSYGANPETHDAWKPLLDTELLEAQARGRALARVYGSNSDRPEYALLTAPITSGGDPFGAIGVIAGCASRLEAESASLELRGLAAHLAQAVRAPQTMTKGAVSHDDLSRVFLKAGEYTSIEQFAFALVNSLRSRVGAEQVALGSVQDDTVSLLAVSGMDTIKPRSPGVLTIRQAMGECLDACEAVVAQPADSWHDQTKRPSYRIHEQWRSSTNGSCVLSIPIMAGENCVAVLSLRRSIDQPFSQDEITQVEELIAPLSGAIPLIRRATMRPAARVSAAIRGGFKQIVSPGHYGRKLITLGVIALIGWIVAGTMSYTVTVPTMVSASDTAMAATPFQGQIAAVHVEGGQRVRAGDPLFTMDTTQLNHDRREAIAELAALDLEVRQAIGSGDHNAASLAHARRALVETQIAGIDGRIERATCRALTSGVIVESDLSDFVGRSVPIGEPVATIVDPASLRLELLVPERRSTDMFAGASVAFLSNARPRDVVPSEILSLPPASEVRDGRTVFVVEAPLAVPATWMKPGMEGVAKIDGGSRPVWWVLFHGIIDAISMEVWPT